MENKKYWRRISISGLVIVFLLAILVPMIALFYTDAIVELWWYQSMELGFYFWQRLLYNYVVFAVATALFFGFFYYNFRLASRYLQAKPPQPTHFLLRIQRRLKRTPPRNALVLQATPTSDPDLATVAHKPSLPWRLVQIAVRWFYLILSLLLAVFLAFPFYSRWEETLLFVFAPDAGITDPVYGQDISYYLFTLPLLRTMLNETLLALVILLLMLSVVYYLELRAVTRQRCKLPPGIKNHFSLVITLIFLVGIAELVFQRHQLLYSGDHLPLFFGPGYTEMSIVLPLIWASLIMLTALAGSIIWYLYKKRGLIYIITFATLLAATVALRYWEAIPEGVQDYIVAPDELARQEDFIRHNIDATLDAFDLAEVETRPYQTSPTAIDLDEPTEISLRNIPVWDKEMLIDVYRQLQELRTYYHFLTVNTDRYTINGNYQQVFLSARELDFDRLPKDSQNWVNRWFKYTHGYGAVMSPAAQIGEEPKQWFLKDIPPRSEFGLSIEEPGIYFGMQDLYDVIAPNALGEISYPGATGVVLEDFNGGTGIPIHGLFERAVFALYYRDYKLFFTTAIQPDSRILIRRNVPSTIRAITPFLELDQDPYLVVTAERLYWILDAYTLSDYYPYAEPVNRRATSKGDQDHRDNAMVSPIPREFNYIRNSVKIVVDAYSGDMTYYLADPEDPIARAYQRMYPGLLKSMDQFPAALKPHIRYPKDLFITQMQVYAKYHQTDPGVFYGQEDRWMFPRVLHEGETKTLLPYYVTLNLIDHDRFEHLLLAPMNPDGRENMRAIVVVSSDGDNYGRIVVYSFPTGALVHGLSQIDALIKQDSAIAQQFTLWGQGGTEVHRGKLILVLVDDIITYVQPVYLKAASGVTIPQLVRVIVSQGGKVAMEASFEEALAALSAQQ
ncbi:UPF0182 family protein [Rhabdochromatium marinum]|uniref:UPF0182 family protein n=1 Tax=Rhabdochromatium marinum TaxID=48729 RepID=UPI001906FCD1|nr:UPF0182 family protein [Rhabdochromatium marinum]MBK1650106.1 hypothetical protein [Rhabdochromatium marinum]